MTSIEHIDSATKAMGTAAAAKALWATLALSVPATVSSVPEALSTPGHFSPPPRVTTQAAFLTEPPPRATVSGTVIPWPDLLTIGVNDGQIERATTDHERLIGEIRRWALMNANWDGEGAAAPLGTSLEEAVAFIRMLENIAELPEPMLLASGHAGLFWKTDKLYADLEFLGDKHIAYFIERSDEGKHKGVVRFDPEKMPAVFPVLLRS